MNINGLSVYPAEMRAKHCAPVIKQNDVVTFKPEWQDEGDKVVTFRAAEDYDGSGRLLVVACLGMAINPMQTVSLAMLATVNGEAVVS